MKRLCPGRRVDGREFNLFDGNSTFRGRQNGFFCSTTAVSAVSTVRRRLTPMNDARLLEEADTAALCERSTSFDVSQEPHFRRCSFSVLSIHFYHSPLINRPTLRLLGKMEEHVRNFKLDLRSNFDASLSPSLLSHSRYKSHLDSIPLLSLHTQLHPQLIYPVSSLVSPFLSPSMCRH